MSDLKICSSKLNLRVRNWSIYTSIDLVKFHSIYSWSVLDKHYRESTVSMIIVSIIFIWRYNLNIIFSYKYYFSKFLDFCTNEDDLNSLYGQCQTCGQKVLDGSCKCKKSTCFCDPERTWNQVQLTYKFELNNCYNTT